MPYIACPDEQDDIGNKDSNMYDSGKILLSKKARNKHEELKKDIFVEKDGYTPRRTSIEAFVVNETSENVWPVYRQVDTITSLSNPLVQL